MRTCPPGWATDLAILEHTGSTVEEHPGHLVVRTPANPDFYWGNFVLVTDPDAVDDADRWVGVFAAAFPQAGWVAIGLPRVPAAVVAWEARGHGLEPTDLRGMLERGDTNQSIAFAAAGSAFRGADFGVARARPRPASTLPTRPPPLPSPSSPPGASGTSSPAKTPSSTPPNTTSPSRKPQRRSTPATATSGTSPTRAANSKTPPTPRRSTSGCSRSRRSRLPTSRAR